MIHGPRKWGVRITWNLEILESRALNRIQNRIHRLLGPGSQSFSVLRPIGISRSSTLAGAIGTVTHHTSEAVIWIIWASSYCYVYIEYYIAMYCLPWVYPTILRVWKAHWVKVIPWWKTFPHRFLTVLFPAVSWSHMLILRGKQGSRMIKICTGQIWGSHELQRCTAGFFLGEQMPQNERHHSGFPKGNHYLLRPICSRRFVDWDDCDYRNAGLHKWWDTF